MTQPWRHLPAPARAIAVAASEAVEAARVRDAAAYEPAMARLAVLDPEQVGLVLGVVVRSVLEDLHPDGLAADDVRAVLEHCVRGCASWQPADPDTLLGLVAGALGVHASDGDGEAHRPAPADIARHAPLLIADLLGGAGRPLAGYLK